MYVQSISHISHCFLIVLVLIQTRHLSLRLISLIVKAEEEGRSKQLDQLAITSTYLLQLLVLEVY